MTLFKEPRQQRLGPMGHAEPRVNWLLTSTRPEACRSRATVNEWYATFPDVAGAFARRLRSSRDVDHEQAVDELFVHHLITHPYRTITYEEDSAGPDFRVYEDGVLLASVEVASLFEKAEWAAEDLRHDRLADELNRRLDLSFGYFIDFKIDSDAGAGDPAPAQIAVWARRQLTQLPDPRQAGPRVAGQSDGGFTRVYTSGAVQVTVTFLPLDPDDIPSPGSTDRIVSTGPVTGGEVTDDDRVRDRVTQKAGGKYDLRSSPFLVVIGVHTAFCDDGDFLNALYGSNAVRYKVGESGSAHAVRLGDGVFGAAGRGQAGWKNQRLSAVCRLSASNTLDPQQTSTSLFHNPFPAHPLPSLFKPGREFGIVESSSKSRRLDWLDGLGLL